MILLQKNAALKRENASPRLGKNGGGFYGVQKVGLALP